jgi:hypothetical protein
MYVDIPQRTYYKLGTKWLTQKQRQAGEQKQNKAGF